ncbi:hypothetical protein [Alkaliphilus crotonatoxidans]
MFSKWRKRKVLDNKIIKKNNVPVLIKDKGWCEIFLAKGNRRINSLSKQLEDLLLEEANLKKELQEVKKQREEAMQQILLLSDLINSKGQEESLNELEAVKEKFSQLNEELDQRYAELEEYPPKIEALNLELLEETVEIAYNDLLKGTADLNQTNAEINQYREKLNQLREHKEELEKKMDYLYSFMHTMVGPKEMSRLDIHYFKENKENE